MKEDDAEMLAHINAQENKKDPKGFISPSGLIVKLEGRSSQ
jgi:hypothetical protein